MNRAVRFLLVAFTVLFLIAVSVPVLAAPVEREATAENRVIMCGRSVMEGWFDHWGWDGVEADPVYRNGYTLQHGTNLSDLGSMVGIFQNICDAVPAGQDPVMFFKFCFVDFDGGNLGQLQAIANQIRTIAGNHNFRLIIGNALPQITADTYPALVNEHLAYNAWLQSEDAGDDSLWVYDQYSVLTDGPGALRSEYSAGPGDSHLNDTAYNALDATYFPFLDDIFGGSIPPPTVNRSWYFAEGTTDHGFEEFICIQNPTNKQATVQAIYMKMAGQGVVNGDPFYIPPYSRSTINVMDVVPYKDQSIRINSDVNVIAERSMYWNNRLEGHDSIGIMEPKREWYLAEGCTNYGFEEYLLLQNAGATDATVNITCNTGRGPIELEPLTVAAQSRETVRVNDEIPPNNVSISVNSDEPVIAERSMYWDNRRGGHDSIGTDAPAQDWFLAEGSNGWGFETWVLLQNPGENAATVNVTYLTESGGVDMDPITVEAGSRYTIDTRRYMAGRDFSTSVHSDQDIIAERAMYWNNGTGKAGHDTIGVKSVKWNCYLAEGCTNYGFETFCLICNPNDVVNNVQVTYMMGNEYVSHDNFDMQPNSRKTLNVNEFLASRGIGPTDVSIQVTGEEKISAERAMYWNYRGGGHDSIGYMSNFL